MKKIIFCILGLVFITSCKEESWKDSEQQKFIKDCIQASNGAEGSKEICECGLQKAMENFKTKKEAEQAIQKMSEKEIMLMYEDCLDFQHDHHYH